MIGVSGDTMKALLAIGGLISTPVATVIGFRIARSGQVQVAQATAQVEASKIAAQAKTDTERLAVQVKSDAERIAEERYKRISTETESLLGGMKVFIDLQQAQLDRLAREVEANQDAIRMQRRDMDAIASEKAAEKAAFEQKIYVQDEKIADLQTSDAHKTRLLHRIEAWKDHAMAYIGTLTQQIRDLGHEPAEPPPELSEADKPSMNRQRRQGP